MCGIAGIFSTRTDWVVSALDAMVAAQTHRGPDDSGVEVVDLGEQRLVLGQRRLSIIDLSPLGRQPMRHPGTGDLLVYNGELYNYRDIRRILESEGEVFRGHSDTEVMLHALVRWGSGALTRFQGMFAIAWFRRAARTLVLARDPVGIKPLYVTRRQGAFLFASEVRAILASGIVPPQISRRGLAGLLAYGAVQKPDTIIEEIRSFPAGCSQEFSLDAPIGSSAPPPIQFWAPPRADPSITTAAAARHTRALLNEAVRDHLVGDVPIGVFLSSGIDSTIIAGLAAKYAPNIMSYTVGFADNPDMSESVIAAHSAKRLGLPHTDVQVTASESIAAVRDWLDALDQPSVDGLNTYVVSGAVRRAGATVALSGLGGDEVFCGYNTFEEVPKAFRVMRWLRHAPPFVRAELARLLSLGRNAAVRAKMMEMLLSRGRLHDLYFLRRRSHSTRQLNNLGIDTAELGLNPHFLPDEALEGLTIDERFPYAAVSVLEMRYFTGNMLLRDSDTNGMAHGLEIRVPMFDTRVLDYALSLTGAIRMPRHKADKHILCSGFADILGPEVLGQAKRGFVLPIKRWMATVLRDECEAAIEKLKSVAVLRSEGVDHVWQSFLTEPESPAWTRAFTLVVLGHYFDRISAFPRPRDRDHSHWRRTPSSKAMVGAKPSSAPLRKRSA